MNAIIASFLARMMSFLPTAVATLLTSTLVLRHYGVADFDSFSLILSLIALIPLNNLGVGAAVTSAYAGDGPDSDRGWRVTVTATRVLVVSTIVTAGLALLLSAGGVWPTLIGGAAGPNLYYGIAIAVYALSFVPGLGQSMLLGVQRNHVTVWVQTAFTPIILAGTVVMIVLHLDGSALMVVPPAALVVVNVITAWFAGRATGIIWRDVLYEVPFRRKYPGASIRALSGPVLVITLATPIALQSDRVVLSHVSTQAAVANYSVAMQIFGPALALIAASAQPLWPMYERARAEGRRGPYVSRILILFCLAALVMGGALALIAGPIGHLISSTHIDLGILLPVTGALVVITSAASYPLAMSLMDPQGARFVGICTGIALPLNIAASIVLGSWLGAPGPLLASVAVGLFVQTLPALLHRRSRWVVGRHRAVPGRESASAAGAMTLGSPIAGAALERPRSA